MAGISETIWPCEKHTEAKHLILKSYIGAWVSILPNKFSKALFVDGFSGPGEYEGGEPGSPLIAIAEVGNALKNTTKNFSLQMYFVDARNDRIENLKQKISSAQSDSKIKIHEPICGRFEDELPGIITNFKNGILGSQFPMLIFIDPFGVKGYPLELIRKILSNRSAEVFLLLDVDGINRNLSNAPLMKEVFGDGCEKIIEEILREGDTQTRYKMIRKLHEKVAGRLSQFYLPFRMLETSKKVFHDMVFLTNNQLGFLKMKEAMWRADSSGRFQFVDTEYNSLTFDFKAWKMELWDLMLKKFRGRKVTGAEVKAFVEFNTRFLDRHKREVLNENETSGMDADKKIRVEKIGRKKNTFPEDAAIYFPAG
ncbi:MAG TPA: three-Cys-motif partner protein TcmP [bacterium]|nr:three-Cys-motif partner protein TcmP [bacterium]